MLFQCVMALVKFFACLKAMKIGIGDEVIVPNITFVASTNAIIMAELQLSYVRFILIPFVLM